MGRRKNFLLVSAGFRRVKVCDSSILTDSLKVGATFLNQCSNQSHCTENAIRAVRNEIALPCTALIALLYYYFSVKLELLYKIQM